MAIAVVTILLSLTVAALNALVRYRALLRKTEETAAELKAMFDTAVDGIIKISAQGEILSFNASAERIFGYTEAEVAGKNISTLMPEPYRSAHDGYLMNYLTTGNKKIIGSGREVTARRKDGRTIEIRLAVGESRIKGTRQFVGFVTDITARKKMEADLHHAKEQAIEAAQVKSTFLANMSHEIRTPMNAILGFTELLMNTPLNELQKKNLGIVRSSAKSLLALLNDILDSAKLESGSTELEMRDFSLHQVCDQVIATLSLAARKKGLRLSLNYAPQLNEFFRGDPLRIQQVILNLLSNAVKFTERGHVTLWVRQATSGKGVIIDVEDSGIGISTDRLEKIFAPFSQADSSMTRRFGGTGLGTTISRQLVELMGGNISVTSTVGEGTTFRVTLPLNTGKPVEGNIYGDEEIRLPPLHILVADDVPQNLELLTAMLESRGHTLVTASNGRQAVEHFSRQPFDLVLMDVQMPDMNGHEACQAIRRYETQQGLSPTPVIALTASVMEQDKRQAEAAGMDGFTCKPISVIELTGEIARVLGRQAASQHMYPELRKNDLQLPIDYEMGRTLWGSTQKHLKAIRRFMDSEGAEDRLTPAFAQSPQAAIAPAHRLKGVAGNLCLPQLARCAGSIEALLKQEDVAEIPFLLEMYQQSLTEITELLEEQTPTSEPAEATHAPVEPLDIEQLNTLISLLQKGEIPEETFAGLKMQFPADVADNVAEALHDFEPERAADLLITYKKHSLACHDDVE
ncbi:ATP-binding protein [Photobacterium sp. MCCC 1A19761]|uniref:PAS domain-containing hybrid sensor histidine kinase/response regulator n=1 Tax=Photobacterium sp. MCCC 1A19761 TaxID=3115000 RepID=UPI00307EEF53